MKWKAEPEGAVAEEVLPQMRIDVVLSSPEKWILIDTKFTARSLGRHPRSEIDRLRTDHLYQMPISLTSLKLILASMWREFCCIQQSSES